MKHLPPQHKTSNGYMHYTSISHNIKTADSEGNNAEWKTFVLAFTYFTRKPHPNIVEDKVRLLTVTVLKGLMRPPFSPPHQFLEHFGTKESTGRTVYVK